MKIVCIPLIFIQFYFLNTHISNFNMFLLCFNLQEIKPEPNWKPSSPILASAPTMSSTGELQMIMSRMADMTALIQTQRSEVCKWGY